MFTIKLHKSPQIYYKLKTLSSLFVSPVFMSLQGQTGRWRRNVLDLSMRPLLQGQTGRWRRNVLDLSVRPLLQCQTGRWRRNVLDLSVRPLLQGQTGRWRRNVLDLSMRPFVCYWNCEHNILKLNEPILMPIDTIGLWDKGMKRSTLGIRR